MARVTGPLFSLDASGQVGKSIVFAKWKGRNYTRKLVIPENPKSAKQTGVRSMMAFLAQAWAALAAGTKDDYDALAEGKQISPFNAYVGENLARWQVGKTPTQEYPAPEVSTPALITTAPLTGHDGYVTAVITPAANADIWGVNVYRDPAEITAPSWANCVATIFRDGVTAFTFTDSPLEDGTYHYRFSQFNTDGIEGTVLADASVAVPPV
ncbi:MAG TPA: hypothetical protein VMY42_28190 [Thermoguttaceae bacterium]|nr:hypothetical protein [Thermoguttaceae bacterium]